MEQKTAMLDMNAPSQAAIAAQVQAAAARGAPPAGGPPPSLMEQKTAMLDMNAPSQAAIAAQVKAAASRGSGVAAGGPPPAAPPGPEGGQRTVMLDAAIPLPPPRPVQPQGARALPPMAERPPPQKPWKHWVAGPGIMIGTAIVTFFLAGVILPAKTVKVIESPPVKERPKGRITLKTEPPGASITVDGKPHNRFTPTTIEAPVDESVHVVLTLTGYRPHEEDILFHEGEKPLTISLEKILEKPAEKPKKERKKEEPKEEVVEKPKGKGTISIFVHPWAIVFVDGQRLRQTPIANYELPAGKHTFQLVNDGLGKKETITKTIKPGSNPEIRVEWAR
jgi:hypothetical protein